MVTEYLRNKSWIFLFSYFNAPLMCLSALRNICESVIYRTPPLALSRKLLKHWECEGTGQHFESTILTPIWYFNDYFSFCKWTRSLESNSLSLGWVDANFPSWLTTARNNYFGNFTRVFVRRRFFFLQPRK